MIATGCPSRETLLQYSLGMLVGEQRDELDSHLDTCPNCQATIATLDDADDTAIGRLRTPLSSESVLAEPQLQRALAAALAMHSAGPDAGGGLDAEGLPAPDMPETLGEYRLLEELGHGGMGRVYKALHTKLDRVVAVKVLSRGRVGDRQAINRFEREMKAVGRLAHPNIVQAYDAREIDGMPVLIMEFVDGLDLAEIVRRVGRLPVADACELVRRTALALQCAHEHGLVHRDIKPSNVMLTPAGEVKLLDLGLARFYAGDGARVPAGEEMTGTGQAMGTADYMAPEQASDSRTVDIRADLYSLGCTLYKLLSGRAPFSGPEYHSTLDKLNAHVHQPVPPVRQFAPDVPEGLGPVLDRLLAKDPDDRFATPAEVAEALAPWCVGADLPVLLKRAFDSSPLPPGEGQGEGVPAAKPSLLSTSRGWKWFAGALALLLLVGGLGFALGIMCVGKSEPANPLAFRTATVTRGDITQTIEATGTIEPEDVLDVGAEVAGTIVSLGADPRGKTDPNFKDKTIDYGSPVEAGMVLARIDDAIYKARVDQQKAGYARAEAELAVARAKAKGEPPEAAKTAVVAAESAVAQAKAALKESEINLDRTIIKSPVKGVIIDRRVNVGQNVAPSPNAPVPFLIAKDLEKMQVWAGVNEADIGRIRKGMEVRFRVDGFPNDVFKGTVTQIRLNATMTQNVVTYTVVVSIENPGRKLLPYMTADLHFQVAKGHNVLRVANSALRWKPTPEMVAPDARPSPPAKHDHPKGTLWEVTADGRHVRGVDVQCVLTDGTMCEVSGPDVKEGMEVVCGQ